jgi:hypothetical protein
MELSHYESQISGIYCAVYANFATRNDVQNDRAVAEG